MNPIIQLASGVWFSSGEKFVFNGIAALAACGGIFCIYLGYRLFTKGINKGPGKMTGSAKWIKFTLTGVGPGLFFMAFGAFILLVALLISVLTIAS
jgi:hypothetical protein